MSMDIAYTLMALHSFDKQLRLPHRVYLSSLFLLLHFLVAPLDKLLLIIPA